MRSKDAGGPRSAPERLGKYEILDRLAAGGMAEVHVARSSGIHGFQKLVAIKRILPQFAADQDFVQMFLDEARIAATLHHSNIAQVYDIGADNGAYFFTMELLQGRDTAKLIRRAKEWGRPFALEEALSIVTGVCAGLHYAHEKTGPDGQPLHLVHRDISPQNIFVTFEGGVKLVDFGIAKATHRATETRSGTIKGKLDYMSPEQCRSQPVDRRSDIFALGIVLWELTTGTKLFGVGNEFETMKRIVESDAPSPRTRRKDYPEELERIVAKALKRSPNERFATARQMQEELESFARNHKLAVSSLSLAKLMSDFFPEGVKAPAYPEASESPGLDSSPTEPALQQNARTAIPQPAGDGRLTRAVRTSPRGRRPVPWMGVAAGALLIGFFAWARHVMSNAPPKPPAAATVSMPALAHPPVVTPPLAPAQANRSAPVVQTAQAGPPLQPTPDVVAHKPPPPRRTRAKRSSRPRAFDPDSPLPP